MHIAIDLGDITTAGGLEKVSTGLAIEMHQRGHKLSCFTYSSPDSSPFFSFPDGIHFEYYPFSADRRTVVPVRSQLMSCAPDIFICPTSHNNILFWASVLFGTDIPLLYSEHSDPWKIEQEWWNKEERNAILWAADAIHLLLPPFLESVPPHLRSKCHVIGNPVAQPEDIYSGHDPTYPPHILSLGRLEANKQIPILIEAFDLVANDFPQWELHIWGEGEDEKNIYRAIERTSSANRIHCFGLTRTPHKQFSKATIFCMPSRIEGFGLVIIEAFIHELPTVAFQACTAANYLINSGENGLLAPQMTAAELAHSLRSLMLDETLRHRIGKAAKISAQAYAPQHIYDQWEKLIYTTASHKGHTQLNKLREPALTPMDISAQKTLYDIFSRQNLMLKDSQIIKRFFRHHPKIKRIIKYILKNTFFSELYKVLKRK